MARLKIPYESLDPLTIGASGDDSKVTRDELELEVPDGNLIAAVYPDEPPPVPDATEGARRRSSRRSPARASPSSFPRRPKSRS